MLATAMLLLLAALPARPAAAHETERQRISTAVGLNYCRASFHRIQRQPYKRVLLEEQEKVLNNLNLNEIADEEVVRLYTAVLQEISEVRIADKERLVIQEQYRRAVTNSVVMNAFDFGTQLATAQYLSAVRTGARSWWDFRSLGMRRDVDVFRVEKERMVALTDKSSHFLDTFWKLARKRTIPDRWLVRGQDLDRLEAAVQEPDLVVRLRVLKRMEEFMECYPPYWYYVARTQQGLGQLFAAAQTYEKLASIGSGHFRKDEMLAAGLANRAVIQEYLHQPGAVDTARQALTYATDVWEANLMCARVLGQHGHISEAEDAILRNLDVGLEREQSLAALVSLYSFNENREKLLPLLNDAGVLRVVPMPILVQCAVVLGTDRLPRPATAQLLTSLAATYDLHFGRDDLVVTAAPGWQLQDAELRLSFAGQTFVQPEITRSANRVDIRFRRIAELGHPLQTVADYGETMLTVKYSEMNTIRLRLSPHPETTTAAASTTVSYSSAEKTEAPAGRRNTLFLNAIDIGPTRLVFHSLPEGPVISSDPAAGGAPAGSPGTNSPAEKAPATSPQTNGPVLPAPATGEPPSKGTPAGTSESSAGAGPASRYVPPAPPDPIERPAGQRNR